MGSNGGPMGAHEDPWGATKPTMGSPWGAHGRPWGSVGIHGAHGNRWGAHGKSNNFSRQELLGDGKQSHPNYIHKLPIHRSMADVTCNSY